MIKIDDALSIEILNERNYFENLHLKVNQRHEIILDLKIMLNWLGYSGIIVTSLFGPFFEERIQRFQEDHQLPITGELNAQTIIAIKKAYKRIDWTDNKQFNVRYLKRSLNELGFKGIIISNKIKDYTREKIKEFQTYYQLPVTGNINIETIEQINHLIKHPLQLHARNDKVIELKVMLNRLGYKPMRVTNKFGRTLLRNIKNFQKEYGLPVSGIAEENTVQKIRESDRNIPRKTFVQYNLSFDELKKIYTKENPEIEPIFQSHHPTNLLKDRMKRFHFYSLTRTNITTVESLNDFLKDRGALRGQGETILKAAKEYRLNELFLIAIMLLQAEKYPQILYPLNYQDETTATSYYLYNVYGFGKKHALSSFVDFAKNKKWLSVEISIIEGARLYKQWTNSNDMYSLYTKLWDLGNLENGKRVKGISKETIMWTNKLVNKLYHIYNKVDTKALYLHIPKFKSEV